MRGEAQADRALINTYASESISLAAEQDATRWAVTGVLIALGIAAWGAWVTNSNGKRMLELLTQLQRDVAELPRSGPSPSPGPLARLAAWLSALRR